MHLYTPAINPFRSQASARHVSSFVLSLIFWAKSIECVHVWSINLASQASWHGLSLMVTVTQGNSDALSLAVCSLVANPSRTTSCFTS